MAKERRYTQDGNPGGPAGGMSNPRPGDPVGGTTQGEDYFPSTYIPRQSGGISDPVGGGPGQAGQGFNRRKFVKAYAAAVARTWTDETYLDLLLSNAADTLAKAGIDTIPGAVIRIIQHKITGSGKMEDQVNAWLEGKRTGFYDLFLPMRPDDFDVVGPGEDDGPIGGGDPCCCCSPCCCCG